MSLDPKNPGRIDDLAYFLIDRDRNIKEGSELIDSILNLYADNYNYLYTKGLGLYKQRKSEEAVVLLKKSWDLRLEKGIYNHSAYLQLEAAKNAIEGKTWDEFVRYGGLLAMLAILFALACRLCIIELFLSK